MPYDANGTSGLPAWRPAGGPGRGGRRTAAPA